MANHLKKLLEHWYPQRDALQWVLATIVHTEGSSYRKPGAMMMINSLGQYRGMLSGGCLESDIMRQARRCWEDGSSRIIQYDMREEEDLAWQLGIGCGGLVKILLQPVNLDNDYLKLAEVLNALAEQRGGEYHQSIQPHRPQAHWQLQPERITRQQRCARDKASTATDSLVTHIMPPIHLAVFGGGLDAIPLVEMAATLGWTVTLVDPRPSYARATHFAGAHSILREPHSELLEQAWLNDIDAAILMNHNVELDASSLNLVMSSGCEYLGILGPRHRTERVLKHAGVTHSDIRQTLANPVGLRLGGELPEAIALSMLAEMHAFFEGSDGQSISQVL